MIKRRTKEDKFIKNASKLLIAICILLAIGLTVIYFIKGGLYSLLFDLRESKPVLVYVIGLVISLVLLILFNLSDTPENKKDLSSFITVGLLVLIVIFSLLLIFTLIDFFFPLLILYIMLTVAYLVSKKILVHLVKKYGIK